MPSESRGPLILIGGHEDREGERVILHEVARHLDGRALLLCAAASRSPERYVELYRKAFADLGVDVRELTPAADGRAVEDAGGVLFSGGHQDRLVDAIGGSPAERLARDIWDAGGVIAGTSAGASAMSDVMLDGGSGETTPDAGESGFRAGLGLLPGVLIDQHFAERGRIGRLATAVRTRPELLGIGIDEDTAAVVATGGLRVIGAGGVYVLDGSAGETGDALSLHLLSEGEELAFARAAVA